MPGSKVYVANKKKRNKKIQEQFKERINEKNERGARPRTSDVLEKLAEDWCLSEYTIQAIIRMKL